jgi:hypothetical protein
MIGKKTYPQPLNLNDDTNSVTGDLKATSLVTPLPLEGKVSAIGGMQPNTTAFATISALASLTATVADSAGANGKPIITSVVNGTNSLVVLCGLISDAGAISYGTGFTITKGATGRYTINFTEAFSIAPIPIGNTNEDNDQTLVFHTNSTTSVDVAIRTGGTLDDAPFGFVCIGQRAT